MTGVRWGEEGMEGRCDGCADYYPLDAEFWPRGRGLRFCRACTNERQRVIAARRRAAQVAYNREGLAANRERVNERRRELMRQRVLTDPTYLERRRAYHAERMRKWRSRQGEAA